MSMKRVSSRPRLVSDADRASQISALDTENENSSYFLFDNHGDGDGYHGKLGQVRSDEEERKYVPAALITGDGEKVTRRTSAANDKKLMSSSISDDTLSAYASCCLEEDTTTTTTTTNATLNSLQRESNPSLSNLEMSFQKTSLSSNEDEGGMEAAAAAAAAAAYIDRQLASSTTNTTACCSKRKRLSQQHSYYYLTPNSSYAELQQSTPMMWYSPMSTPTSPVRGALCTNSIGVGQSSVVSRKQPYQQHLSTTTIPASTLTLCAATTLPEETLINIATHLTHNDIRSFGSTCHSIRMVVMRSTCALETLWMEKLRCQFPVVFGLDEDNKRSSSSISDGGGSGMMHSSNINFVDDFELPLAAARNGFVGVYDNVNNTSNNNCRNAVNLPLLTGLLAPRYPQKIELQGVDLRASFGNRVPFRSFEMTVPRAADATTTAASPMMMDEEGKDVVSVIQFTGTVGTGDRSIRSDKPFPPNCRAIDCSNSSSSSSHGGASLKSLSTWMKNHTPLRSRGNKRKNGRALPTHSMLRDLSPPPTPRYNRHLLTLPNPNLPLHTRRGLHLPLPSHSSSQRSPLFRFLSSLSHHCDCVNDGNASSYVDYDNEAYDVDDIDSNASMELNHSDDDQIGVNDYGMMIRHNGNGLLEQCRQKLGYNKSIKNNLRPFVIPTVLSSSPGEGVTVDVTPGLVAYFEVTIMDQRDEASRTNESDERHVPQQQQQPPHHAGLRHRGYHLPRPLRRNIPLGGHRLLFLQHAQDRLAGQVAVGLNNIDQQPPQQQRLHHGRNDNAANIRRPRQHRHECVAIGLSTLSFNPRSRMPGWDEHSFGYHGDDGGIFHGHGDMLRRYGPSFGPGDTVGCGLDYSTRKVFFVKNGEFLGWAFENVDEEMLDRGLYPTVGVDTECPVHVNFGKLPFKFDLKEFGREKLYL